MRGALVLMAIAAWFCLSNHCAIGMVAPPAPAEVEADGCPMHSAPAKKKPATKPPCCKEVRAVLSKCVTVNPAAVRVIDRQVYATEICPPLARTVVEIAEVDTGPPCLSFAESVLQESMPSHAPPCS